MRPPDRATWQPELLVYVRRIGGTSRQLRIAADLAGVSMKTLRRHILRDNDELGREHPCSLGALIREADAVHRAASRVERRRRLAREEARAREVRTERARRAAEVRWHGGAG